MRESEKLGYAVPEIEVIDPLRGQAKAGPSGLGFFTHMLMCKQN